MPMDYQMVPRAGGMDIPVATNALDDETRRMIDERMGVIPQQNVASPVDPMAGIPESEQFVAPMTPGGIPADPMAGVPGQIPADPMVGVPGQMQQPTLSSAGTPPMAPIDTTVTQTALDEFGKATSQEADVVSAGLEQKAMEQARAAEEIAAVEEYSAQQRERAQQRIEQMSENLQKLNSEIESTEIESPSLLGKTAGDKIMASLAIALGNIGAALTGQKSNVMNILKSNVNRAVEQQKAEIAKKQKAAERANNGLQKALDRFDEMPEAEAALKSAIYDKLTKKIEMIENMTESQRVKANAQVAKAELQAEMAKNQQNLEAAAARQMQRQEAVANRQREVIKAQPQNRLVAAGFAARMMDAEDVFKQLEESGYNRADVSAGLGSMLPNVARTSESLMQEQAERNFVNAKLRQESGAAISESEFENAVQQYFPRAGDTPEVIKQKRQNRETDIAAMAAAGGNENLANIAVQLGKDPKHYTDRDYISRMNKMLGARPAE